MNRQDSTDGGERARTAAPVGIDDLNLYASSLSIDSESVARARGFSGKDLRNVGFARRSVVPIWEDPVTLAVNAATPLLEGKPRENVELLIVATESGLDFGKPISSYVHKWLGLGPHCRNFEIKHACYGGTAALQMATAWVRASEASDPKALVIASDIARRHSGEAAELTAGSGAVAMLVTRDPRVLRLEPSCGRAAREIYDVARPTATTEYGNPVLSLYAYLDLLEMAWSEYRQAARVAAVSSHFRHFIFHAPLISLVERAHRLLLEADDPDVDDEAVREGFARSILPTLKFNVETGNLYSGSVFASLAGLIDQNPKIEADARVGIFSYGSGSCAEMYSGLLAPEAHATVARHAILAQLGARRSLTMEEYDRSICQLEAALVASDIVPDLTQLGDHFEQAYAGRGLLVLDGIAGHHRTYRRC